MALSKQSKLPLATQSNWMGIPDIAKDEAAETGDGTEDAGYKRDLLLCQDVRFLALLNTLLGQLRLGRRTSFEEPHGDLVGTFTV